MGGAGVALRAPGGGGVSLDPGGVGRGEVSQALVGPVVVVALTEGAGQVVVLEQDEEDQETVRRTVCPTNVLERLVPTLDLAPRVWGWQGAGVVPEIWTGR